jgi:hypothetical protein
MSQTANDSQLPLGPRSKLTLALFDDNPVALSESLDICTKLALSVLVSDNCGQGSTSHDHPWSKQASFRYMYRQLYYHLTSEFGRTNSLHNVALDIAVEFGSVRVVSMLLSEKYRSDVDPAYKLDSLQANLGIHKASKAGHTEIVRVRIHMHIITHG